MKKYLLSILLISFQTIAQNHEPLIISGNNSPLTDVIVKIDLFRVCSNPTNNNPNYFVSAHENTIDLRISIYKSIFACDPLPPNINNYMEVNLGQLNAGEYELNILFVSSEESVITGTPFLLYPFQNTINFQVAKLRVIPTLNLVSLIILMYLLLMLSLRKLDRMK